jgi:PAS domain S-box-containing protein
MYSMRFFIVSLVLVATIPILTVAGLNAYSGVRDAEEQSVGRLRQTAIEKSAIVTRWVNTKKELLTTLSARPASKALTCESSIQDFLRLDREWVSVLLMRPNGEIACSYNLVDFRPPNASAMLATPLVANVISTSSFGIGNIVYGPAGGNWLIFFGQPIFDEANQPLGYIFVASDLAIASKQLFGNRQDSAVINVVDRERVRLMRWPEPDQYIGKPVSSATDKAGESLPYGALITAPYGEALLTVGEPVADTKWQVTVSIAREFVVAEVRSKANILTATLASLVAFVVGVAYFGARLLSAPIQQVATLARAAAANQLFSEPSFRFAPTEITETAKSLLKVNQDLAASEARYRSIIDTSPVPAALNDDRGNIVFVNAAFVITFGFRKEQIPTLGDWWPKAYPEIGYREWVMAEWARRLNDMDRTGAHFSEMDVKVYASDGRQLWASASARRISINGESFILVTLVDITEREKSREKERLYTQIWEQSSDYLTVFDKGGRVVDINPAGAKALGYNRDEVVGRSSSEFLGEQVPDKDSQRLRDEADDRGASFVERVIRRKDGSSVRVSSTILPLRDAQGNVTSRLVVSKDQSQEEQRQALLRRYASLLASAADPILTIDRSGVIQFCNPAGLDAFGYTEQELAGQHLDLLLPRDVHKLHRNWIEGFFASSIDSRAMASLRTVRGQKKCGAELKLQITLSKSNDPDGVFATAVIRDITSRVQLEEQLKQTEKLAAFGQLTGGIAHDVNNDLAVILGAAELINEQAQGGSRLDVLSKRIIGTVERSASLVQRMLAFSRKAEIVPVDLDLSISVKEIVESMRRTLAGRVDLRYSPPSQPAWVHVDRSVLESSLINLAVNARDAMPNGGTLTFAVATERREIGEVVSDWVVLMATDTGIGMSEEVRNRVFEPFFTTKPMGGGTGLGLSTVYGFVHQSGGNIEVQSEVGKGTTFTIWLPQIALPGAHRQAGSAGAVGPTDVGKTVLIVEDNEILRTTLKEQLQAIGSRVIEAGTVDEAQALIAQHHAGLDYILSDLDLGAGPSGIDLAEWVKQQGYSIAGAIVSGYLSVPNERIAVAGWDRIQKPVKIKEVAELLKGDRAKARA